MTEHDDDQPGADGAPPDEDFDYDPPIGEDPDEEGASA